MNEPFKEQLSALLDGELDRNSARFLLRRLETDSDLRGRWQRLHVVHACLRGQHVAVRSGFSDAISAAIAADAIPQRHSIHTLVRWAGGFAVAASVAVAALLIVPGQPQPTEIAATAVSPATAPATAGEVVSSGLRESDLRPDLGAAAHTVAAIRGAPLSPSLRLDPQIDAYLLRHSIVATQPWQGSFAPLIPVAVKQPDPMGQGRAPQ